MMQPKGHQMRRFQWKSSYHVVATGPNNSKAIVTTTVQIYSFASTSPAVLYSKDNTTLNGSSISISGNDAGNCGGSNLSAVYVYSDPSTNNTHTLTQNGNPYLNRQSGDADRHDEYGSSIVCRCLEGRSDSNADRRCFRRGKCTTSYGSSTNYVTVYSDATQQADGELRLNNVTGYGILVVKGNLQLAGNIDWHGIIIATGVLRPVEAEAMRKIFKADLLGFVVLGRHDGQRQCEHRIQQL
jgi:hypothetical protein